MNDAVSYVYRWDFHFLGLDFWVELDCDSRFGRFLQRRGV